MLDKESIRDAADMLVVIEELGIPYKNTLSHRLQILCPCHNDQHFGSCFVNLNKKNFVCYSCVAKGDIFALAQHSLQTSFEDAVKWVAETCGGSEHFQSEGVIHTKKILPKSLQDLIGIQNEPVYIIDKWYSSQEEVQDADDDIEISPHYNNDGKVDGYCSMRCVMPNPLLTLYSNDILAYRTLIDNYCKQKIEALQNILQAAKEPLTYSVGASLLRYFTYSEIVEMVTSLISKVQRVSLEYGNGSAIATTIISPYTMKLSSQIVPLSAEEAPF